MISLTTIAILITCHNRKEKTLKCLSHLYVQKGLNQNFQVELFLVDDRSTDGTSEAIQVQFPDVNIIQGNGNLFWNQGMRLAWQTAAASKNFDYYLWLNDDTYIDPNCITTILRDYKDAKEISGIDVLLVGACRKAAHLNEFSYGGRDEKGPVCPNQTLQQCRYINGNIVLVPIKIYLKLGILSNEYTHGIGDFDYGLRALQNGFRCLTTRDFIATCEPHSGVSGWCDPNLPLFKRWSLFHSPKGLNIKEYNLFRKKFWGEKWIFYTVKAYFKMLCPRVYKK
jgi:GT2 family glycosyltransferase